MPLTSISAGVPASQRPQEESIETAVIELQGHRAMVVTGGTATTQLTATGLQTKDVIISAIYYPISTGTVTSVSDITSEASIPAADKIAFSTTNTTSGKILVLYYHLP